MLICLLFAPGILAQNISIVPRPQDILPGHGIFTLEAKLVIMVESAKPDVADTGRFLADALAGATGFKPRISESNSTQEIPGSIFLTTRDADPSLGDEGYQLQVTPQAVTIRAPRAAGLFYGVQTFLQLLPPEIYSRTLVPGVQWSAPAVTIKDQPRFRWRGIMLDVSRHFESKEAVLRYLDLLAIHKMNVFHWHLTDDQGWRIEIKKYPLLTEIGAWRDKPGFNLDPRLSTTFAPNGKYGGFYTQDDIREVVRYAAKLHIVVVPEIEMPGHSTAALAAYPELSITGGPFSISTSGGIFHGVYCAGDEKTFAFLQDVLTEVMDLFPSTYIHIGGDEVPADSWDDARDQKLIADQKLAGPKQVETYFINRISRFIDAHGRKLIGWDEILNPDLAPDAAVMSWRGTQNGIDAVHAGHDVVMTPTRFCYLDGEQGTTTEPLRLRGWTMLLAKAYSFDPVEGLTSEQAGHILGVQGNLWTEYVPNADYAQYMTWPRAAALAEVGWTAASLRNFDDFKIRAKTDEARLDVLGINYRPVEDDELQNVIQISKNDPGNIEITQAIPNSEIHYTLDGSFPTRQRPLYTGPFSFSKPCVDITAGFYRPDTLATIVISVRVVNGRVAHFSSTLDEDEKAQSAHPDDFFHTTRNAKKDDNILLQFDSPQTLNEIAVEAGSELPNASLETSADGKTFSSAASFTGSSAKAALHGTPIRAVRIRFTAPQDGGVIIREFSLK